MIMKTFETVEQIKQERHLQRENPVIYSLLGVLLGEIDRLPIPRTQSPTEDQIYTIVKKLYEGAELLASKDWSEEAKIEYAYLKDYIKAQFGRSEIEMIISDLVLQQPNANIGLVMKYFKDNYSGQYDGKLVSQIAKEIL
jgi:uncharacterized protein YqeY